MGKFLNILLIGFLAIGSVFGQKGIEDGSQYGHGDDSVRCRRNWAIAHENARNKLYKDALNPWRVVFNECPKASKNVYLDGDALFSYLIENESDAELKSAYVDTLMLVYDKRIEYFDQRGFVLGKKGVDYLRYNRENIEDIKKAYEFLKESVELEGNKSTPPVMATFMTSTINLFKNNEIESSEVIQNYVLLSECIDQILARRSSPTWIKLKEDIDEKFASSGAADCEVLVELYTPKYNENSNDEKFLSDLVTLLNETQCQSSDLYYKASESLYKIKPSAMSASSMASLAINNGDYQTARNFFTEAIELETDDIKKGETYYSLAIVVSKLNKNEEARGYALKAANYKPNWGDPYILIANIYANSKDECGTLKLPNSIYWVAVDMYKKAKAIDSSCSDRVDPLIESYSKYFPNKEEAFFLGINPGDSFKVGCWINESTIARF